MRQVADQPSMLLLSLHAAGYASADEHDSLADLDHGTVIDEPRLAQLRAVVATERVDCCDPGRDERRGRKRLAQPREPTQCARKIGADSSVCVSAKWVTHIDNRSRHSNSSGNSSPAAPYQSVAQSRRLRWNTERERGLREATHGDLAVLLLALDADG